MRGHDSVEFLVHEWSIQLAAAMCNTPCGTRYAFSYGCLSESDEAV